MNNKISFDFEINNITMIILNGGIVVVVVEFNYSNQDLFKLDLCRDPYYKSFN
jgi:hypothetical protein